MTTIFSDHFKGMRLFCRAFSSTKHEMWISVQILAIITIAFSVIMYMAESISNPNYDFWDALVWTFVKFVDDPAEIAEAPTTTIGQIIGTLVGVLGIAIFAVPAGLIGSGFIDAMAEMEKEEETNENVKKIKNYFNTDYSTYRNENFWPARFERISRLQSNLHLTQEQIIGAVDHDLGLRIVNFAVSFPDEAKSDPMAVELTHVNTDYGYCSDLESTGNIKSSVLVISLASGCSIGTSYNAFHMARIGRFNFISNEFLRFDAPLEENRCTNIGIYDDLKYNYPKLDHYVNDILRLSDENTWVIIIDKTVKDTSVKVRVAGTAGDSPFVSSKTTTVDDVDKLKDFYDDLKKRMEDDFDDITVDADIIKMKDTYLSRWLHSHGRRNVLEIDLNRDFLYNRRKALVVLTQTIHDHFERVNRYGLNLIPMKEIPTYRGRETETILLTMPVGRYFTLHFEPQDIDEAKVRTLGFAMQYASVFSKLKDEKEVGQVTIQHDAFDDAHLQKIVQNSGGKQTTFRRKGSAAFSLDGRMKSLLKQGKYKVTINRYDSEVLLSYEFAKTKRKFENGGMVDNPFDASQLCINVEEFNFPGLDDLNGKKVMHTDEILYDGLIVDGQIFISDRNAVETQEFYFEVGNNE